MYLIYILTSSFNFFFLFLIYLQSLAVLILFTYITQLTKAQSLWPNFSFEKCSVGNGLKYISGNALTDSPNCVGPNSAPYPRYILLF